MTEENNTLREATAMSDSDSSDSIGAYNKRKPRQSADNDDNGDESPLPANTPTGRKKAGRLGDLSSFQRNMESAHEHFSLEQP